MFKVDPALFSSAENNIILGMKELDNLKRSMNECALSFPDSYEFTKDINEVFLKICNLHFDSDELLNKVTFAKKKLCELDKGFALTYYACALQNYAEVSGELTVAQEEYIKYSQSQYYDSLYNMLEENKDNLTPEQAEIYKALKEQKEIEKKYDDLQKLYQEKEDNNGFWHPIIESDINKKIANLEKELGIYENKWYEDIGQAFSKTGAEWSEGFSSLFAGEGFGELWDATKQTFATGAVVSRSVGSGFAKLGELIVVDGLSLVGGSLASGATWLFHDIWTDNDLADNVMDSTLDFVRRDLIGEANESFYENTSYGNWLNENSNLKYDSAGAKAIQTGSEFVGKIALATAATIFSGGMAAPIALGALYGTGKATERYTQSVDRSKGEEYSYDKALGKALAGAVGGSAEFYGYGRMGSAIYNGLSGLGSSATASASQASTSTLKNFKRNFFEVDTLLDSSAVVADHGVDFLTGDKSFDEMLKSGGTELLFALGLNAVGAGISAKLETKSALKVGESYFKPAGDLNEIDSPYVLGGTSKVEVPIESKFKIPDESDLKGVIFDNKPKGTMKSDILTDSVKTSDNRLKPAGDLNKIDSPYVLGGTSKVEVPIESKFKIPDESDLKGVVFDNKPRTFKTKNIADTTIDSSKQVSLENIEIKTTKDLLGIDTTSKDLEDVRTFLLEKQKVSKEGPILYSDSYYTPMEYDIDPKEVKNRLNGIDIGQNHFSKGDYGNLYDYDYRITLMTGDNFKLSEFEKFIKKFDEVCVNRNLPYNLKVSFDEPDAFIIYTRQKDLLKYKEVLDYISNEEFVGSELANITKKFHKRPFSLSTGDNSYYGISMGSDVDVSTKFLGDMRGHRTTFGDYTEKVANSAYIELANKYSDISKITPEEMLDTMKKIHNSKQGVDINIDLPLWMNQKIYNMNK